MDPIRLGLALRALRIRRGWRQQDLADRVGLSHGSISNVERGRLTTLSVGALEQIAAALDARLDVAIRWRGEQLDRLLDEGHARLVEAMVRLLVGFGWEVAVEVTFAVLGERGSIDVLGRHASTNTLLVIEVKTVMPDAQAMLATLDRKTRLAPRVAGERGWPVQTVARLIVFEGTPTARQRVGRLEATLRAVLPARGATVRAWLRAPAGPLAGILFVRTASPHSTISVVAGRQRVRRPGTTAKPSPGGVGLARGPARPGRR
jgi:transcriptional regulator with XRE-family HTH domain